jgi:hypothetical protein
MEPEYISEDEFWEEWGVIQKADGDLFVYEDVKDMPVNQVWTILESGSDENDNWYASPGLHYVNRLGYVLTQKPWIDETRDAIYFLNDMEHDDAADDDAPNEEEESK